MIPPTAAADTFSVVDNGTPTTLDVVANDLSAPDSGETLTVTAVTQGAHGTVTLHGGVVSYQSTAGFSGADTFTYTISDGNGGMTTATVTVNVTAAGVNAGPAVTAPSPATTLEDTPLALSGARRSASAIRTRA